MFHLTSSNGIIISVEIKFDMYTLHFGYCFSISYFSDSNLSSISRDESSAQLLAPTCKIILEGDFLINGFIKSYMSSMDAE